MASMISSSRRFANRSKFRGLFPVFLALAGFLLSFLIILNLKIAQERAKLQSETANLQREIKKSQEEREQLAAKMSQAQSEEYLEKIARQELNLQEEGEKVVAFPVLKAKEEQENKIEERPFWQKISDWLLKKLRIK